MIRGQREKTTKARHSSCVNVYMGGKMNNCVD